MPRVTPFQGGVIVGAALATTASTMAVLGLLAVAGGRMFARAFAGEPDTEE